MADNSKSLTSFIQGLLTGVLIVVFTQSLSIFQEHQRLLGVVAQLEDEIRQNSLVLKSGQQKAASGSLINPEFSPDQPWTKGLSFDTYDKNIAQIESDSWWADTPVWSYYLSARLLVLHEATWTAMGRGIAQRQDYIRTQLASTLQNLTSLVVNHDKLGKYNFMLDLSTKQLALLQQFDVDLQKDQQNTANQASKAMNKEITDVLALEPAAQEALHAIERHCIKVEVGLIGVAMFFLIELSWFFVRQSRRTKTKEARLQEKDPNIEASNISKPKSETDPDDDAGSE